MIISFLILVVLLDGLVKLAMNAYRWMGVLTGIAEKHRIPVFAMKDTEESYATNQFASKFEKSNFSSILRLINWINNITLFNIF